MSHNLIDYQYSMTSSGRVVQVDTDLAILVRSLSKVNALAFISCLLPYFVIESAPLISHIIFRMYVS